MMWSISISYRLGLGFHALNNEGSDGSNLMQPRRIDVGKMTYDGISGEMVRRHVLENFVRICEDRKIDLLTASRALHPDRGPLGLREVAKESLKEDILTNKNVFMAARKAVERCALVDVGGYLAAFSDKGKGDSIPPESDFLKRIAGLKKDDKPTTVKRDSVFDVGWLISEEPQEMTVTQHAAYRPTGDQSMFSQTMRSNVYGGVIRADLHRVGTDDYWYLNGKDGKAESRFPRGAETPSKGACPSPRGLRGIPNGRQDGGMGSACLQNRRRDSVNFRANCALCFADRSQPGGPGGESDPRGLYLSVSDDATSEQNRYLGLDVLRREDASRRKQLCFEDAGWQGCERPRRS
jgi:CRISPR-associated autoregulator DevR family